MIIAISAFGAICCVLASLILLLNLWFLQKNFKRIYSCFEGSERFKDHLRDALSGGVRARWLFYGFVVGMLKKKAWYVEKGFIEKEYLDAFPKDLECHMVRLWTTGAMLMLIGVASGGLVAWLE